MTTPSTDKSQTNSLNIGWANVDITPDQPVLVSGQFHARVSEGVLDPISATVLAIESLEQGKQSDYVIFVTCDLVAVPDTLRVAIRKALSTELPEVDGKKVICHATHTHASAEPRYDDTVPLQDQGNTELRFGVALDVMNPKDYSNMIAGRIAKAIASAWKNRKAGGISHGLSHAVVGSNRRVSYFDGSTQMYGNMKTPEFSHIEGTIDTSVNLIYTWDQSRNLTGVAINLACPSQVRGMSLLLSADYWCQTRQALRKELGEKLHIISFNSPSGDLVPATPKIDHNWRAQERMWALEGIDQCQDIGQRITGAVTAILPLMKKAIQWELPLIHQIHSVELPKRQLCQKDVDDAMELASKFDEEYFKLKAELDADPSRKQQPHWYMPISKVYSQAKWNRKVATRFEEQKINLKMAIEVHVVRLGDIAFATNPFEYYLDFAWQIKARSSAIQTFLMQHVGTGTYLPTERAVKGGSYGALPASTPIGPDGGRVLANWTVNAINALFPKPDAK